jgi:isocitrate/isopropylmalate dehydrogenase
MFPGTGAEHVIVEETQKMTGFKNALERAFESARRKGEAAVVVVEKGNVLQHTHGQWGAIAEDLSRLHGIQVQMHLMDSFVEKLIRFPDRIPSTVVADATFTSILQKPFALLTELQRNPIPNALDGLVARENTEGMYIREGNTIGAGVHGVGMQRGRHTRAMILENIRGAMDLAEERKLDGITILALPETHPKTTALWSSIGEELARKMKKSVRVMSAGDFVCDAIFDPARLHRRVFAADNLLGDICGDAAAGLVGGLGIPPTNSFNTTGRTGKYFFEPLHGSAPDIAGKGIANPTATMLTVGEVFSSFGRSDLQAALHRALYDTFESGVKTPDCGGTAGTDEFSKAVLERFSRIIG